MAEWKPNTEPPKTVTVFRNIAKLASQSDKFRRVVWTGRNSQLVIMTVPVGGEIGEVRVCVEPATLRMYAPVDTTLR